jgi:putative endonuclease
VRRRSWVVYLLRCGDGTLYCGVTNDLPGRLEAHRAGRGARYTRGRSPLEVVYVERAHGRGDALRREHAWKRLPRAHKLARIDQARQRVG